MFNLTIISLMLRYEIIIKPSFGLKPLSKFWDCPRSNLITCSTSCTEQTQLPQDIAQLQVLFKNCQSRQTSIYLNRFIYFENLCLDLLHWCTQQMRHFIDYFWSNHVLIFIDKCLLKTCSGCILMETFMKQTHSWEQLLWHNTWLMGNWGWALIAVKGS